MNLTDFVNKISFWKNPDFNIDDPITLVFIAGISTILALLLLLKFAFISMRKADETAHKISDEKQN